MHGTQRCRKTALPTSGLDKHTALALEARRRAAPPRQRTLRRPLCRLATPSKIVTVLRRPLMAMPAAHLQIAAASPWSSCIHGIPCSSKMAVDAQTTCGQAIGTVPGCRRSGLCPQCPRPDGGACPREVDARRWSHENSHMPPRKVIRASWICHSHTN